MFPRPIHALALLAALAVSDARPESAPAAAAKPAEETMAEHRLKDIVVRQKVLFADAAAQGKELDEAQFKSQVEQLDREYSSLLRDNPEFAAGYASYGYMLWKVGVRKRAVEILLKANQLDPNIPLVKNELGNYLAEEGKPVEALNYFLSAIDLEPGEPLYHYQLGTLLYEARDDLLKSGEWTRAALDHSMVEAFRKASELAPERVEFAYRYGESFYDLREPDWPAALRVWEGLEARAQSEVERQTMRLHQANVLLNMGKREQAVKMLDAVRDPALAGQKQKLVAKLGPEAGK